jgi:hypothetical protein
MKRLLAMAVVVSLAFLAFQVPAGAQGNKRFFDGTTAQGLENFFIVENIGGVPNFEPFFTNFTITCNGNSFNYGWFFIGFQIPLGADGYFDINLPSDSTPFDWHGKVVGLKSKGVQSQGYAAYNSSGGLVDCGTGPVKWKAAGVKGSKTQAPKHGGSWVVTVTKHANGKITESITHG